MSLKRTFTKLAIAFVAAKGVQAFQKAGGLQGVKEKLAQQNKAGGGLEGMLGRIGGAGGASSGGLGNILSSLGMEGTTGGREGSVGGGQVSEASGVGDVIGSVAGMTGDRAAAEGLLARTRAEGAAPDTEREAGLAIRAMIQAARADGDIDAQEQKALMEILGESDAGDQRFIDEALSEPVDPAALARDVPQGAELEVYSAALMAIDPDNRQEAEFLHALAQGLSLDQDRVNKIHSAMGKQKLY